MHQLFTRCCKVPGIPRRAQSTSSSRTRNLRNVARVRRMKYWRKLYDVNERDARSVCPYRCRIDARVGTDMTKMTERRQARNARAAPAELSAARLNANFQKSKWLLQMKSSYINDKSKESGKFEGAPVGVGGELRVVIKTSRRSRSRDRRRCRCCGAASPGRVTLCWCLNKLEGCEGLVTSQP